MRKQSDLRSAQKASREQQRLAWELEDKEAEEAALAARTSRLRSLRLAKEVVDKQKAAEQATIGNPKSKS